MTMSIARQIVSFAIQAGSSDIHLEEGAPIAIRVNSDIKILENILKSDDMTQLLNELVGEDKLSDYQKTGDLDTSIGLEVVEDTNQLFHIEKHCLTLHHPPMTSSMARNGLPNRLLT